ncbi:cytochrome b/b6 domain-containing protein [beta proteobacterium MWH-UniP1]
MSVSKSKTAAPGRVYIRVWDPIVRIGHWLLVLCFAAVYFYADKFPLHAYAAYLIMAYMAFRIFWGVIGPRPVRFRAFVYSPKAVLRYGQDSLHGHSPHTISHNPLGGLMVISLILIMLICGVLGLMVYSAGQEMGLLGSLVPSHWEGEWFTLRLFNETHSIGLKELHHWSGNLAALLVAAHVIGNLITTALHRSRPVVGMITGVKDADRDDPELAYYPKTSAPQLANSLYRALGPVGSELVIVLGILLLVTWPLVELLVWANRFIPSY